LTAVPVLAYCPPAVRTGTINPEATVRFTPPVPFNVFDYFLADRLREGQGSRRALLWDGGSMTYQGVHEASGRFARILLEAGIRPEERVIVALPDGPEWVAGFFGILRMGGVVVMVNPDLRPDQIRGFYEYTRAGAAFVPADRAGAFHEAAAGARHTPALIEIGGDAFRLRFAAADPDVPTFPSHPDDAAAWIFSGGTTGLPKAVVQPHRSFANTCECYGRGVLELGPDDVTLSVPKLFFGYATGINLLFPFSVGATSALFPERCTADTLFSKIATFQPTVLVNVPTMVNHMVGHPAAGDQDLSGLRLATSAGEALPIELHRRWDELWGVPLLDGLGTAEMWHIFLTNRPDDVRRGTLGRAVPGFHVEVRDEAGTEVPRGTAGRLWVRGDSRAIAYWQRMDETQRAFQGEWYASGDMVVMDDDGYVTYEGRADDMLKVAGKWLSPKALEDCLLEHPNVREVTVVGVRNIDGLVIPKAFVVPRGTPNPDELTVELQRWAKERLEPDKYPREVAFVQALPRTHLGKVDRGALGRGAE
jgi:benzoate-CoA ligase family protein